MRYGSGPTTKLQYGKRLAACLAYLILRRRDAAGVSLFDTGLRQTFRPTCNLGMMGAILDVLDAAVPSSRTRVASVLHDMAGQIRRKGIVILISDLFDDEHQILDGIQHLRFGGNEVIVFHLLDPAELEFPFRGLVEFVGLEGLSPILTRPLEIRRSYLRELDAFRARLREGCERNACHYVLVNTGTPLHEALGNYLAYRLRTSAR
jgi:uncharacterized protein (DUF58 family)